MAGAPGTLIVVSSNATELEPATASSWNRLPMPEEQRPLAFARRYDAADAAKIRRGHVPQSMLDQWFIFVEGGWLHVHRADTGVALYRARLDSDDTGGVEISEAWINDNRKQRRCVCVDYDAAMLGWVISAVLLGAPLLRPTPPVAQFKGLLARLAGCGEPG